MPEWVTNEDLPNVEIVDEWYILEFSDEGEDELKHQYTFPADEKHFFDQAYYRAIKQWMENKNRRWRLIQKMTTSEVILDLDRRE